MPVLVRPATHPPRAWSGYNAATSAQDLLRLSCPKEYERCSNIIQSSFNRLSQSNVSASQNGFVYAAVAAYSHHHHLSIRPEDVWFAILTQLSLYINANAEELRDHFVSHEGQKELEVTDDGSIHSADFGKMAVWMTYELEKNIVDPDMRQWLMPNFTTTEDVDRITAAVLFMGSMQKYFTYRMRLTCGIPSVTLLGEREDWLKIRDRVDKIPQWGLEPTQFATLLTPILDYFVRSFDSPTDPSVTTFWSRIAHKTGGSGTNYLSGWITAFCFWNSDGRALYQTPQWNRDCDIEEIQFPRVDTNSIPDGFVSVPVTVDDHGDIYKTRMVAGSVGIKATSSGDILDDSHTHNRSRTPWRNNEQMSSTVTPQTSGTTGLDSIQPLSGWWMYELVDESDESGRSG
ncbi:hypothetical protein F4821DRAFT_247536 [Hypoxylon rubiginosum]|uniref:Uncharacterized protein n=1 Tax=Hypoxylon rubiginosum TaxID=110542 RepID=A0ACC0CPK2_9PEZI|nr:hypothetical protein F4821DRAFT_247536 [Hypoxylon rubiginosum]